jgi:hypothetical protein
MRVVRQIASPEGVLEWQPERAAVPVEGAEGLDYGRYFDGLEAFVTHEPVRSILAALAGGQPETLWLRAEKHGALYHPASLTLGGAGRETKLCVNVAVSAQARAMLEQEAGLLAGLRDNFTPVFLPAPHAYAERDGLAFLLEDWFAGYHEFHQDGAGNVRLWDYDIGLRSLSQAQAREVYTQAARILTRYYHAATGAGIGPWHHAAGDFVARVEASGVSVRLITVRGYGASRDFSAAGPLAEKFAALGFFTNMTMRLRLDRVEGVGALVVAGPEVAEAAVAGFLDGLAGLELEPEFRAGLIEFLASFSPDELTRAAADLAWPCPDNEAALLAASWPEHAAVICAALGKSTVVCP